MRYILADNAPVNLYARIYYQELSNKKLFHNTSIGSLGDVKVINFNSTPSDKIINKHHFEITLLLYEDSDYRKPLGSHQDIVWFDMPVAVADVLNIQLL